MIDDRASKKYIIQKLIYGAVCGCFLHKTIFYYINIRIFDDIINNLDCIIYTKMKKNKEETFNTSIIIQIIIFFGSIFCQKISFKI